MEKRRGGRKRELSEAQQDEAASLYVAGLTGKEIAVRMQITERNAFRVIRERRLTRSFSDRGRRAWVEGAYENRRPKSVQWRRYSLNEAAFDDAHLDPVKSYWVGFMLGDGNVIVDLPPSRRAAGTRSCHEFKLSLAERDRGHVEAFRDFLGSTHPVKISTHCGKGGPTAGLTICSRRLTHALMSYGVVPRKSTREEAHPLLAGSVDFWRGLVDADGWVCRYPDARASGSSPCILGLCGGQRLCEQFLDFVRCHTRTRASVLRNGDGACRKMQLGWRAAYRMTEVLYSGAAVSLPRKQAAADRILRECGRLVAGEV